MGNEMRRRPILWLLVTANHATAQTPTAVPTASPTDTPSSAPTFTPTDAPTNTPVVAPTTFPTDGDSPSPTPTPTILNINDHVLYNDATTKPHQLCSPLYYATCQPPGNTSVAAYTEDEYARLGATPLCTLCNPVEDCNAPPPDTRTTCYPFSATCALCGSPLAGSSVNDDANIGPSYTVTIRPECTSNANCDAASRRRRDTTTSITNTTFTKGITFKNSNGLVLQGANANQPITALECPIFTFVNPTAVTIQRLVITCKTSTLWDTGPGILFKTVTRVTISAASLAFSGYVRSGILVLGGNFQAGVVPPVMAVNLDGSSFSAISITGSSYRAPKALSLASYYGVINLSGLAKYTQIEVQPSLDPATDSVSSFTYNTNNGLVRGGLFILNLSAYTAIFGPTYEISADNKDAFSYSSVETEGFKRIQLGILSSAAVVLTVGLFICHQDELYYYLLLKRIRPE